MGFIRRQTIKSSINDGHRSLYEMTSFTPGSTVAMVTCGHYEHVDTYNQEAGPSNHSRTSSYVDTSLDKQTTSADEYQELLLHDDTTTDKNETGNGHPYHMLELNQTLPDDKQTTNADEYQEILINGHLTEENETGNGREYHILESTEAGKQPTCTDEYQAISLHENISTDETKIENGHAYHILDLKQTTADDKQTTCLDEHQDNSLHEDNSTDENDTGDAHAYHILEITQTTADDTTFDETYDTTHSQKQRAKHSGINNYEQYSFSEPLDDYNHLDQSLKTQNPTALSCESSIYNRLADDNEYHDTNLNKQRKPNFNHESTYNVTHFKP